VNRRSLFRSIVGLIAAPFLKPVIADGWSYRTWPSKVAITVTGHTGGIFLGALWSRDSRELRLSGEHGFVTIHNADPTVSQLRQLASATYSQPLIDQVAIFYPDLPRLT